ncbi:CPBP family intramembrane metalloprotease [Lacrimispora sp. NSJ-141]|uniref:CPBP family intramembrane metalloprotease n=1 Tax=Lientehia hominis TaxID=2897778 RepID=A0AAP2RL22_9FIRM|nr:type II CAAX endopeptidase family protein [Lientehia hominis]MCD2492915.1 CPBP family intramembrane metalloprotease [Lientehia hominis]
MDKAIKKLTAVLCCLALPILFYEQAVFFVAKILNGLCSSLDNTTPDSPSISFLKENMVILYSSIGAIFISAVLGIVYHVLKKRSLRPADGQRLRVSQYGYAVFFGVAGAIFFNLLMEFSRLPELLPASESIEAATAQSHWLLTGLCTCLLIPVAEELIFRGMGFLLLRKYMGYLSTALLTSVTFALFHGNAPQIFYGFCMGLLLAHTTEHYRTLLAAVLFHCAANLTSFSFLGTTAQKELIFSVPVLGLSGIAAAWLYHKIRDIRRD